MNIFQQLWEFVRDRLNSASLDELDAVFIPSDEVLYDWIATLSESDKQRLERLAETAREIHHAGRDYMQFLATTYYLHQTRSELFAAMLDIARRKAAPLLVRFEGITDNEWTESELDRWLDSLDEFLQYNIDERVRSYVSRGGTDLITLLCTLRRNHEAQQREQARRNRISLLHMWYLWDEEHRNVEIPVIRRVSYPRFFYRSGRHQNVGWKVRHRKDRSHRRLLCAQRPTTATRLARPSGLLLPTHRTLSPARVSEPVEPENDRARETVCIWLDHRSTATG